MDPRAEEVAIAFPPYLIAYKDGRIVRPAATDAVVPPGVDASTGVASKDAVIDPATGVSARIYRPADLSPFPEKRPPVLVYFHGGAFCIGSAFSFFYHAYLNALVARAKLVAVSVEYRLAPEHPIPAAYNDSWAALQWVVSGGSGDPWLAADQADLSLVFVAGDSAGANIAHNMAMKAGEAGLGAIEGAALICPYFWGTKKLPCEMNRSNSPMIPQGSPDKLWPSVSGGADNDDPRINPVAEEGKLAGLGCRRVLVAVAVAERDILRDRGREYCEGLRRSGWRGTEVELWEAEGEDHVFQLFKPTCEKAGDLMNRLVAFLS